MNGLLATSVLALLAGPSDTQWMDNYGDALQAARAAERPLLVVLEDSDHDLKALDGNQADLEHYVVCRIDATTSYGTRVAQAFKTSSFPYAAVIDKTGRKILDRKSGSISEDALQNMLASYRSGNLPQRHTVNYRGASETRTSTTGASVTTSYTPSYTSSYGIQSSFSVSSPTYCPT